jgi:LemA protein
MLPAFIIIISIIAVIVLWAISTQRKLVVLDENISNAMSQIGVQLSSRFDALSALLDLTKGYAKHEMRCSLRICLKLCEYHGYSGGGTR